MSPDRSWRSALFNSTALLGLSALAGTTLLAGGFAVPAQAQNWTGSASNDWFTGANWDNGQPPPSAFDGVLNTVTPNATVINGGDASVRSLTLGGGPGLIGDLSIVNGGTLAAGSLGVGSGGGGGVAGGEGTITVSGVGSRLITSSVAGFGNQSGTGRLFVLDGGVVEFGIAVQNAIIFSFTPDSAASATVSGNGSMLSTLGGLTVARQGNATLSIDGGGAVSAVTVMLGEFAGALGEATVNDSDSSLDVGNTLTVGGAGNANLEITGGGAATAGAVTLGQDAGAQGTLEVSGAGSTLTHTGTFGEFVVGFSGNGTFTVGAGAVATSGNNVHLGLQSGAQGSATVTGAGSQLLVDEGLFVGRTGAGMLSVGDGGRVEAGGVVIGVIAGGTGAVTVAGAGSVLDVDGLTVAEGGGGGLIVEDGGLVDSANGSSIGVGGTGAVTVTGAGSVWNAGELSFVGFISSGSLEVLEGGVVNGVDARIGNVSGSQGAANINGAGSAWNLTGDLIVGVAGNGALTIADGGAVSNRSAVIGNSGTGTVTVTGPTSTWTSNGGLLVGQSAGGNGTLVISAGGAVTTGGQGVIGLQAGSQGTATVTGAGSSWTISGDPLFVGASGNGALTIADGGAVSNSDAAIGLVATGTVMVTGPTSTWTSSGTVEVGQIAGGIGTLTLADGATASAASVSIATFTGSTGTLNIGGGPADVPGTLNTGTVTFGAGTGTINFNHTGTGYEFASAISGAGTVNVLAGTTIFTADNSYTGATTIDAGATLQVGNGGASGSIASDVANDGALIFDRAGTLTYHGDISGSGALTKTGAGRLTLTGNNTYAGDTTIRAGALEVSPGVINNPNSDMVVGAQSGDNGALRIVNGGSVSNRFGFVGSVAGSQGTVTVSGANSTWVNSRVLFVGDVGIGTLTIEDGGAVSDRSGNVGTNIGSQGTVTVTGPGSSWTNSADLVVGGAGIGTLTIADGGTVSDEFGVVGAGFQGTVTVSGQDSTWTNNGGLFVGGSGAGTLTIEEGGTVSSVFGRIGTGPFADGAVTVTGQGSTWTSSGPLVVGVEGTGVLTVADGGVVGAAGAFVLADQGGSQGTLNFGAVVGETAVAPGTLAATTVEFGAGTGTINFNHTGTAYEFASAIRGDGSVNVFSGTTLLTGASSNTGATNVNGGTLLVNGLLGNTATTVANGAILGGTGSIAGDVTVLDGGILAPGASAGTLTLGSLTLSGGSILDYELGQAGVIGGGINDLTVVTGDLVLDGTLNITDIGGFGPGVYRLMNYGGALTDNALELGSLPAGVNAGDLFVQTRISGQVNLINNVGAVLGFWDGGNAALHDNGANDGGDGVWDAANRNWTEADGTPNGRWNQDFAIFGGSAGTVAVNNSAGNVSFTGMQFMTDGYVIDGDALTTTTDETIIRVDLGVTAEIGAAITGSGGLVKQDTGTLVLSGANGYAGGTSILNGTLQVSSDANLGAASGNLVLAGGTLRNTAAFATARDITLGAGGGTFQTDAELTASGVLSGAGALTKTGGGVLTLTGSNSYAGGTTVSDGRLIASVTGAIGTGPVTIGEASGTSGVLDFTGSAQAGTLAIKVADLTSSLIFVQNASAGAATIDNSGQIFFFDTSSAGTATIVSDAGIPDGNGPIPGNGGGVIFRDSATAGSATITNLADSNVVFSGNSTADGATIINGGLVDISNLEADGIGIGSLSGAGTAYLGSKSLTLGGLGKDDTISGVMLDGGDGGGTSGSLVKVGTGTLTLTGANAYTGGTTVNAGRLDIGGGSATGLIAGDVEIMAGGTLAFNRSDDLTFDGLIGGDGTVEKLAGGTLILTGDSNAFAGSTTVNAGTLAVNGTLGGALDVLSGGRLEGTGTIGTTTVTSGGTIAPGNSIDTLSVAGDITFAAGSTYEVEIEPGLDGDLIDASGAASIDGGTVRVLKTAGTYTPGSRWTIVSADGGVAGEFGDLTQNMPFVDLALAYDPNNVYLDVTRNDVSFCDVALTFNQCSTGTGVEGTGPGNPIYDAVAAIPDEESARQALDALSGEMHASLRGAFLEDSRFVREAMLDRTRSSLGGIAAPALPVMGYGSEGLTPEQQEALVKEGKSARVFSPAPADSDRFAVWARGFGSWGTWDSNGNAADFDRSIGGLFVGADAAVAETWRVGLVTGYSRSSFHVDDRASSSDSDNYHLGLFGGTRWGNLGLSLGAAHTWHDIETGRGIAFPGFAGSAEASYDARTAQVFGELGYQVDRGSFALEPFANLAYVNVHTDGFAEDGGAAALTSASGTTDATFTTLGLRASTDINLGSMLAAARGMLGWRHTFGDVTPFSDLAFAGGEAFTIAGTPIAEDALVLEAGFDVGLSEKTSLGVSYSGQIASDASDHGFRADLTVKF
ncbi:autotransporter domain-containing protein [Mesorhizobium sp. ZC-5]|uniref:autotransporter domain-containing protein n=1 Tax=Mesorhizobium sp. ZC-5 TaxID=2986066 RepID=UPI0021E99847|nr:autotransporter domain-containing protein [Mesorhizobium sp. ZC-5]MCV3243286.1 autotransporter domain-containing protein [Mesorhizobium sp. ZC-5]